MGRRKKRAEVGRRKKREVGRTKKREVGRRRKKEEHGRRKKREDFWRSVVPRSGRLRRWLLPLRNVVPFTAVLTGMLRSGKRCYFGIKFRGTIRKILLLLLIREKRVLSSNLPLARPSSREKLLPSFADFSVCVCVGS